MSDKLKYNKRSNPNEIYNFLIEDNYAIDKSNSKNIGYLKINPSNIATLTNKELELCIDSFAAILTSISSTTNSFKLHIYDTNELIEPNLNYINGLNDEVITKSLLHHLRKDNNDEYVKSYVISFHASDLKELEKISNSFINLLNASDYLRVEALDKKGIIKFFRNFLCREFVDFDLAIFEEKIVKELDNSKKFQKLSKNKKIDLEKVISDVKGNELTKQVTPHLTQFKINAVQTNNFLLEIMKVKNYPTYTSTNALFSNMLNDNVNYTFIFEMNNQNSVAGDMKKMYNISKSNMSSSKEIDNIIEGVAQEAITETFSKMAKENTMLMNVSVLIGVYGKTTDEVSANKLTLTNTLAINNITTETLRLEQKEGYSAFIPLSKNFSSAKRLMPVDTIANFYPFSSSTYNDSTGVYLGKTSSGSKMFIDFSKRTDEITSPSIALAGTPGQGKTWTYKKIVSEMMLKPKVNYFYNIDVEGEMLEVCDYFKGTNVNVASNKYVINPFEIRNFDYEEDADDEVFGAFLERNKYLAHLIWLKEFLKISIEKLAPIELDTLMILVGLLYEKYHINEHTNLALLTAHSYPIFDNLYELVKELVELEDAEFNRRFLNLDKTLVKRILTRLTSFVKGENKLFNGKTNLPNAKVINFDFLDLLNGDQTLKKAMFFNVSSYIWSVAVHLKNTTGDEMIFSTDELHQAVNRDSIENCRYYNNFSKRNRKYKIIFMVATQQLMDLMDSSIIALTKPILNNASFKFIFHPAEELDLCTKLFDLKQGEVNVIKKSNRGNCLLLAGSNSYKLQVANVGYEEQIFGNRSGV